MEYTTFCFRISEASLTELDFAKRKMTDAESRLLYESIFTAEFLCSLESLSNCKAETTAG